MNDFTIGSVKHGTKVINQIVSSGMSPEAKVAIITGSGQPYPGYAAVMGMAPKFNFVTSAIKQALANLGGIMGIKIDATKIFNFWFQQLNESLIRSGADHDKGTIDRGFVIPQTMTIPAKGPATISYLVVALSSNGVLNPIAIATGQALDAGQINASEVYTLGPVAINGSLLTGVDSVTVNFGVKYFVNENGSAYPVELGLTGQVPSISFTARDYATCVSWRNGAAQNATDSVITIDKVGAGGVRETPITLTLDDGIITVPSISGSDGQSIANSIVYQALHDGTSGIMTIGGLT